MLILFNFFQCNVTAMSCLPVCLALCDMWPSAIFIFYFAKFLCKLIRYISLPSCLVCSVILLQTYRVRFGAVQYDFWYNKSCLEIKIVPFFKFKYNSARIYSQRSMEHFQFDYSVQKSPSPMLSHIHICLLRQLFAPTVIQSIRLNIIIQTAVGSPAYIYCW